MYTNEYGQKHNGVLLSTLQSKRGNTACQTKFS